MPYVAITLLRLVDDSQPGWVEGRLIDGHGQAHLFVEKVPVVSGHDLDVTSRFPLGGVLACQIVDCRRDIELGDLLTVDTEAPDGVESTDGKTLFDVRPMQFLMCCPRCGAALMSEPTGETRCSATGSLISRHLSDALRERFVLSTRTLRPRSALQSGTSHWFCPGCHVRLRETAMRRVCPMCENSMTEFVFPLVEFNPHPA